MKRALLSLTLVSATALAFGQRSAHHATRIDAPGGNRGEDSVVTGAIANGPLTVYASNSGFVVGNNDYEDKAKAQYYDLGAGATIDELLFFFGAKVATSGDPNSKIVAKVWNYNGTGGITPNSSNAPCPGTVVASTDVNISAVDTVGGNLTSALLGPVWVGAQFLVGFDVTTLAAGDSVGLVSTEFGNTSYPDNSWELWSDDTWHSFSDTLGWGDDLDMFIAVVFDQSVAGIGEETALNGMQMSFLNGNVVDEELQLAFSVPSGSNTYLMMHDATGRELGRRALGTRAAGTHNESIDTSALGAGQYYVTLVANGSPLTKKVTKR